MANILVVDDDTSTRTIFKMIIEDETKHQCDMAEDGVHGYETATNGVDYDLIFVDVRMPRMNGIELIAKLRELPKYKNIPIYVISSTLDSAKNTDAEKAGATAGIQKPVSAVRILNLVEQAFE